MFLNILQIGAFTGNDDVHDIIRNEPQINALLIEPVPWNFDILKRNYSDVKNLNRIIFDDIVINTYDGECQFNCIEHTDYKYNDTSNKKNWALEISSLKFDLIKDHSVFLKKNEFKYKTLNLKCLTPSSLLKKYNITDIELLKIDAEGFDYEILMNWPFDIIKPKYVQFETAHLDGRMNRCTNFENLRNYLISNNYKFLKQIEMDIVFVRKN